MASFKVCPGAGVYYSLSIYSFLILFMQHHMQAPRSSSSMVRGVALLHDDVSSFLHGSGDDATTTTMTVQIRRQWAQIWA
jgi:hypothetical protein